MYLNILEKGIPQLRVMVEKGKVSVAFASRITGLSAKKQKSVVAQIKKCNKTVDANRYIATYMKTERVKKMTGRGMNFYWKAIVFAVLLFVILQKMYWKMTY